MPPVRNAALASALSGTLSSLISMLLFYPLDATKTREQAGLPAPPPPAPEPRTPAELLRLLRSPLLLPRLAALLRTRYAGARFKVLHTLLSSFCFFYLSALLRSLRLRQLRAAAPPGEAVEISAGGKLLISCAAAALNTLLTLPADALTTRAQAGGGAAPAPPPPPPRLYAGLPPSLLLCLNPALHHLLYDSLRELLLVEASLSAPRAFAAGVCSKYAATVLTYPLILAKVRMMTSRRSLPATLEGAYAEGGAGGLFKGLELQLGHTVLKAAVVMVVRERIHRGCERAVQLL
ncbi:hypothetical protein TeGR_g9040 [Tetraparma gracilis]|uniref:Mitochondrial carrier domain-containing protein n=1 Tax=Tetraparma gracilis TaxID=2962635 RepID=A0ABQ6MQE6_9STRA|nr:hypothetical protein TeGR_g9040 [Tetraparma gracilis]